MITIIHTIDTDGVYDLSPGPGSVAPIREGGDLGDVEVAAGEDGADAGAGEVAGLGGEEGGDAGGDGGFDYELHAFHDAADGGDQVAFGDGDHLVDQLAEQREGERAREGGAEAVGDRAGGDRDGLAGGQGGGGLGLDGDDAAGGVGGADGEGGAAGEAAAADGDDPDVERAGVLDQFQGGGALAGDDLGVVERVDEGETTFVAEALAFGERLDGGVAVEDDLGAVAFAGGDLGGGGGLGHDHGGLGTDLGGGPGEGCGVVAGGDGDQAAVAGLLGQGQQAVEGAADLERAGLLERLGLDHDLGTGAPVEGGRGHHRGPVDPSGDPSRCRPYRRCVHPAPPCAVLVRPCRQTRLSDPTGCYGPAPVPGRGGSGRGPRRRRARPAR